MDRRVTETSLHGPTDGDAEVGREGEHGGHHRPGNADERPVRDDPADRDDPVLGAALLFAFLGVAIAVTMSAVVGSIADLVHPVLAGVIGGVAGGLVGALWGRSNDSSAPDRP